MSKLQCYLVIIFGPIFLPSWKIGWWKSRLRMLKEEDVRRKWNNINSFYNDTDRTKAWEWYLKCRNEEQEEIDQLYKK